MAIYHPLVIAIYISSLCITIDAKLVGFSMDLINRDSPNSPFYNDEETPNQRLDKAMHRSMHRPNSFSSEESMSSQDTVAQPDISFYQGEYLIRISIGVPSTSILAVADTGSDLIWTQCKPCSQCLKQETPPYDPTKSLTYKNLSCQSTQCLNISAAHCSFDGNKLCNYAVNYGDKSFTKGRIAYDTITLGSTSKFPVSLPNAIIGCGHSNKGNFVTPKVTGVVGLGGGSISLVSQLSPLIGGSKFSYCLIPYTSATATNSSKLHFGQNAVVSGEGVQTTPLVSKIRKTFYYVTLEAVSVDDQRIEFLGSYNQKTPEQSSGNLIIDTGTTMTLLPGQFFEKLESEVDRVVRGKRFQNPTGIPRICYYADSVLKLPEITLHLTGADMKLSTVNTFVNASNDVLCFTFNPLNIGLDFAILGNMAQTNFLIGFHHEKQTVSFKPTDCAQEQ